MAERHARVVWEGDLAHGSGAASGGSGALDELPVTWASRTEEPQDKTSPEELIAAAHAACYAMSLSGVLARAGTPPEKLEVSATSSFDKLDAGFKITRIRLDVQGRVAGIDSATFEQAARQAEQSCPVSNALRGNVEISVEARLAS
ncbi:MAG: OsmC family peroxiredoxin [Actinomycetota bacterium]|nr:OsmC family peroxiredoxin [Actinomycetota bacterium]